MDVEHGDVEVDDLDEGLGPRSLPAPPHVCPGRLPEGGQCVVEGEPVVLDVEDA